MKARLVEFGEIEVEGKRYTHDVVIDPVILFARNRMDAIARSINRRSMPRKGYFALRR